MNILLLSQFFSTTKGGGEYVFSLMAQLLADSGNNVWIITNKIKGEMYPTHKNIKIIFVSPSLDFRGGHPPTFKDNMIYSLCAIIKGFSIIKKEKIEIIHSNNFAPALSGSVLSLLTSKPHITVIHDVFSLFDNFWDQWGKQEGVSRLSVLLGPIFEKLIIRLKCSAIHTVSEASKDDLIKFGTKKPIYVIHNAIAINNTNNSETIHSQFIYIGRLIFYKNLEVVIKSINIVKQTYPRITLIIVGGGPNKNSLEQLVNALNLQDNVKFKGHVSDEEKNELLSSSQAMVFPSLCEGFGLVILEAFAHRKPVLVSNVRPSSDIVENNHTGFVISPHDETQWAKVLMDLIADSQKAQKMGIVARETLEKKYNPQNMLDSILKMYVDFIKQ